MVTHRKWWMDIGMACGLGCGRMVERLLKDSGGFWSHTKPDAANDSGTTGTNEDTNITEGPPR
jgi:hypothetical protein